MRVPNFFIVGAPKCATTAMHAYLRQHPAIFMPVLKELHFYGRDLMRLPSMLSEEAHDSLFLEAGHAESVGETCIWALYSQTAAREINEAHPQSKIIIMLRNPVEMLHALHSEYLIHAIEDITDFARALEAEPERKRGERLPPKERYPAALYAYHEIATFSVQVERYFQAFGEDRVHIIVYDDLKRDTGSEYRRVLEFLGVDASVVPEFRTINSSQCLRSPRLQRLLVESASLTEGWCRCLRPLGPERVARLASTLKDWNLRSMPRPPLQPAVRDRLEAEFAPEVERLGALIGRDLSHWSNGSESLSLSTR